MALPKKYLNYLDIKQEVKGNEERYQTLKEIMKNGTFLPKTLEYKDIDASFKEWVEDSLKISFNDKILPTMVMYSNQRFTEYSQTWKYTDENKNLILNFKTITRENNPQYGNIQGGYWNIPGNRFYLMKKQIVLDDNGSESVLALKMKQPMAVDFNYKVSIYTTNFETINEFNRIVNDRFKSRQDYIFPNGHAIPMTLEDISDKSSYEIDDRQFYSQSYDIKVMGYIITENDYRVEEQPLKIGAGFRGILNKKKADVEIEVYENPCNAPDSSEDDKYDYKPVNIAVNFPNCITEVDFDIDINFVLDEIELDNVKNFNLQINGEEVLTGTSLTLKDGDNVEIKIYPERSCLGSELRFIGYNPDIAYSDEDDDAEGEEIIVDANEENNA